MKSANVQHKFISSVRFGPERRKCFRMIATLRILPGAWDFSYGPRDLELFITLPDSAGTRDLSSAASCYGVFCAYFFCRMARKSFRGQQTLGMSKKVRRLCATGYFVDQRIALRALARPSPKFFQTRCEYQH